MINNYAGKRRSLTAWLARMRMCVALNNKQICNSSARFNRTFRNTSSTKLPLLMQTDTKQGAYSQTYILIDRIGQWMQRVGAFCLHSGCRSTKQGAGFSTKRLKTQWEALQKCDETAVRQTRRTQTGETQMFQVFKNTSWLSLLHTTAEQMSSRQKQRSLMINL